MKSQAFHTVWCYISAEAAGEIWNWSLLGVKGLIYLLHQVFFKDWSKWNIRPIILCVPSTILCWVTCLNDDLLNAVEWPKLWVKKVFFLPGLTPWGRPELNRIGSHFEKQQSTGKSTNENNRSNDNKNWVMTTPAAPQTKCFAHLFL